MLLVGWRVEGIEGVGKIGVVMMYYGVCIVYGRKWSNGVVIYWEINYGVKEVLDF